jgi:hypothetical protein
MTQPRTELTRDDLFKLHQHYNGLVREELEFCFKYFNFYIGLLSALVAATITGFFQFALTSQRGLLLFIGPVLVVVLAVVGYNMVRVFYRRYIEAWITSLNIDAMLGLRAVPELGLEVKEPLFKSQFNEGFITEFNRPQARCLLELAKREHWSAEKLLDSVLQTGDTLRFARWTFSMFAGAALVIAVAILLVVVSLWQS